MGEQKPITAFEVVSVETGEVVHTVKLQKGTSERMAEKVERGLMLKTDLDRFFVREVRK